MIKKLVVTLLSLQLFGCTINKEVYENKLPVFNFEHFFKGNMCAWGTVKNRDNQVIRKFIADINAYKKGSTVVLEEQFSFDDGSTQARTWQFEAGGELVTGIANDVIGSARGKIFGDSLHLLYRLEIQIEGENVDVDMEDWLHLLDKKTLMGTTKMSKWGFNVGEIDILMRKHEHGLNWCRKGISHA